MFFKKKTPVSGGAPVARKLPSFVFRWRNSAERHAVNWLTRIGKARARVKDFSSSGMYLELEDETQIGSMVEFVVAVEQDGQVLQMVCTGEIARVVQQDGRMGLGVKFTKPVQLKTASADEEIEGAALWRRVEPAK